MTIPSQPSLAELPSATRLLKSTLLALVVAVVLLVTVVLPAEYGVDPTGVGRVLGLKRMGEIKMQLAQEAAADEAADAEALDAAEAAAAPATASVAPAAATQDTMWRHTTIVTLAPTEGKEVKLLMPKGAISRYSWSVENGVVNYDMHGDSTGAPNSYVSYKKGTGAASDSGSVTAAMDGAHGWFWRNRTRAPVVITLRTTGAYTELKKMY